MISQLIIIFRHLFFCENTRVVILVQMEINKQVNLLDSADLRMRAEQQCKEYAKDLSSKLITDEKRLLHELQVYKIELEMQNEDLRNALILADEARTEAEYAKESYIKLFDFAPMSYFILGQEGVIQKINFHGARLLGNQRSKLVGQQFRYYVKPEDLPIYQLFLKAVFSGENKQACELKIQTGETQYYLSLEAIANQTEKSCLMTAVDISDRKLTSELLDKPWFNDREMWPRHPTMLATQRINRFHLAFGLGYDTLDQVANI